MPNLPTRDEFERVLTEQLSKAMVTAQRQFARVLFREGLTYSSLRGIPPEEYEVLRRDLERILNEQLIEAYIQAARNFAGMLSFAIDEGRARELAETWAREYVPVLARNMITTTQNNLARIADRSPNLPLNRVLLLGILGSVLSASRSAQVAVTETSNAISNGEAGVVRELQNAGNTSALVWFTQLDERVCPVCAPRHGKIQGEGWQLLPPAHPNCRCYLGYRIVNGDSVTVIYDDETIARRLRR